jgi:hypothetical protein
VYGAGACASVSIAAGARQSARIGSGRDILCCSIFVRRLAWGARCAVVLCVGVLLATQLAWAADPSLVELKSEFRRNFRDTARAKKTDAECGQWAQQLLASAAEQDRLFAQVQAAVKRDGDPFAIANSLNVGVLTVMDVFYASRCAASGKLNQQIRGICARHADLDDLPHMHYLCIDADLYENGTLNYDDWLEKAMESVFGGIVVNPKSP